jgi:hypothetical protein
VGAEDVIGYAGPVTEFKPTIGGNFPTPQKIYSSPGEDSYADVDRLDKTLAFLVERTDLVMQGLESELVFFVLPVPVGDKRLTHALAAEWPKELGDNNAKITYRLYRYLGLKKTASATYIRQRYEDAIRDYTGTQNLDLHILISMINEEAKMVQEFRATYIGVVDDPSEYRTIELFMDWADGARVRIDEVLKLQSQGKTLRLADTTLPTTVQEARQAQAMFKVKLNSANHDIATSMEYLRRNFSEHAATFYGRFLGPALQFRLSVGRNVEPFSGRVIGPEMETTKNALDTNLVVAQADQLRRNMIFETKVPQVLGEVTRQNVYRNYITQLAPVGQSISPGMPGTVIQEDPSPKEVAFFESADVVAGTTDEENLFAMHSSLGGILDINAHPQYLLKDGDILQGNLAVADNIRIDGVDVNLHRHTGVDGTQKVLGTDISPGTVPPDVVDHDVIPATPIGLRLIGQTRRIVPPGVTVVDVQIAWDGDPALQYEVQNVPID